MLVAERGRQPFTTSARLVELVRDAIPAATRRTGGNPAKRTFQALRIEVNDELGALRRAIPVALQHLSMAGRIVVMSYQSLEDRIVKRAIAPLTVSTIPLDLPVDLPGHDPEFAWLTRGGAEIPTSSRSRQTPGPRPRGFGRRSASGRQHRDHHRRNWPPASAAGGAAERHGRGARQASTTASSRRAYERRQRRTQKITGTRWSAPASRSTPALNRAPFVVVLIALLAGGIVAVLYLNTVTDEAGIRTSTAKSKPSTCG